MLTQTPQPLTSSPPPTHTKTQEAEKRAAILDALAEEDEMDEEEEAEFLRVELPDVWPHFRNFEWRVRRVFNA